MPDEKYRVLKIALVYLADLDRDYAQAENSVGFSQAHTRVGHRLADEKPFESWTRWDLYNAYKIAIRYSKTQLPAFGIQDLEPPPKPEARAIPDNRYNVAPEQQVRTIALGKNGEGKHILVVRFDFDWAVKDAVKTLLPRARFCNVKDDKHWEAPISAEAIEGAIKLHMDYNFQLDGLILDLAEKLAEKQAEVIAKSRARESSFRVEGLDGELYPFQVAGIEQANRFIEQAAAADKRQGVGIFDAVGLGKTVQSLALVNGRDLWPVLVICPASVKINWMRECKKWLPALREPGAIAMVSGRKTGNGIEAAVMDKRTRVVIVNPDILEQWVPVFKGRGFAAMICDEAHMFKGYKTKRTKAVKELSKTILPILLTGTPVMNRPSELWSLISIAHRQEHYPGGFWHFMQYYAGMVQNRFGNEFRSDPQWLNEIQPPRLAELSSRSRASWMIRRDTKDKEELLGLPPIRRNLVYLDLPHDRYDKANADVIAYCGQRAAEDKAFLAGIAHLPPDDREYLKKERAQSAEFKAAQAEQLTRINALRQLIFELKWPSIQEWLTDNFIETGRPGVIFAYHREAVEQIAAFLKAPMVMGGMSAEAKQRSVDAFMAGESQFIVGNIMAMGVGLTLTKAEDTVFCELAWRPSDIGQAEGRIHRIGQKSQSVSAHYLLGDNTIDTEMGEMLNRKLRVTTATTDSDRELDGGSVLGAVLASFREGQQGVRVAA